MGARVASTPVLKLSPALFAAVVSLAAGFAWAADPMQYVGKPPLGLPPVAAPKDNLITRAKAELGRALFFDPRLSADGSVSCASCHNPSLGFSNGLPVAAGYKGRTGTRNSPTIFNVAYGTAQFWDGRAASLEQAASAELRNRANVGPQTIEQLAGRLNAIRGYRKWFEKVFRGPATPDRIVKAIATFERTILSGGAPVDRYLRGDRTAMSPQAVRGFNVFKGKGRCALCHSLPNFSDGVFHNLGVGMDKPDPDLGRYNATKEPADKGRFKTPTLRNIADTPPYMHDGSQKTLAEVVEFYDDGGAKNPNLDLLMKPLHLTDREEADLTAFMEEGLEGAPLTIAFPKLPQ